jgi:hypothetical protein
MHHDVQQEILNEKFSTFTFDSLDRCKWIQKKIELQLNKSIIKTSKVLKKLKCELKSSRE